ncbi:transcription factor TGA7 isoform X2 [Cornus florida]|uniref:transcription factor TGA7 isoform X2 n=1 Tax=Cornus florida TaxID=4283 RepID=UPI00289E3E69|nr:transcription factor TGA7 isoform X2 [Cornus florida]
MSYPTQFATTRMDIFEPLHQMCMWEDTFKGDISPNTDVSTVVQVDARLDNKSEYTSHESPGPSQNNGEANNTSDKQRRRLAQNREAARKSRLRKKAYVQQLETSRMKLTQMEQELERTKQQGMYSGSAINTGVASFEMEYGHWVEEQHRKTCELRKVLQAHISDIELRILVEGGLNHYYDLFRMKADAAKADVFFVMSGMWRTPVERFFLWIGGFRPSELLHVLMPQLEPLTDQQHMAVCNLHQSSQEAEDALSQGIDKLQQTLGQSMVVDPTVTGSYSSQMASAIDNLKALETFVNQIIFASKLCSKCLVS